MALSLHTFVAQFKLTILSWFMKVQFLSIRYRNADINNNLYVSPNSLYMGFIFYK